MRIILVGGGSGGSTAPLLAVAVAIRERRSDVEFLYVGSAAGPESALVEKAGLPFIGLKTGKLRRYWSLENFVDVFRTGYSIARSLDIIRGFHPDVLTSAGGFVCVPPALAAWLLRVPVHIHQQDVQPGLANKIIAPVASKVTVTFEQSRKDFPGKKTILTGNPVRPEMLGGRPEVVRKLFHLENGVPILLVTGGGTGAAGLNRLVELAAPRLVEFCQVIHLCGQGKRVVTEFSHARYHQLEFVVDEMKDVLAAADLVISRAGLSTLTELGALGKPSILIPMPDSHQRFNALAFASTGAALILEEKRISPEKFAAEVEKVIRDGAALLELGNRARAMVRLDAAERIAEEVVRLAVGPTEGERAVP